MSDLTNIVLQIETGDANAAEQLLPLVYDELRNLAAMRLACEKPGQTLQATALVHEAYLRLVGHQQGPWQGRRHFFAAAAEAMRRILVERARQKNSSKHGGNRLREELPEIASPDSDDAEALLALNEALAQLVEHDPLAADLVKFRYFAGLTMEEAAEALGISERNAYYAWAYARSWLRKAIDGEPTP
jgi:RNA polymerase sigma factor (TIGR02999 family)